MRGEFMLVDAVLEYAPANLLLDHDDALGGFGFSFEVSLEEYADVVAFGQERPADSSINRRANLRIVEVEFYGIASRFRGEQGRGPGRLYSRRQRGKVFAFGNENKGQRRQG